MHKATKLKFLQKLWVRSAIAFALAGMIATTLHELAHLVAGFLVGEHGTFYPNAVDFVNATVHQEIITALAGPLFSIISGLIIIFLLRKPILNFWGMFGMWLGFLSAQIGFGYLIIAPFVMAGDTGAALALLNAPGFVYFISFVLGLTGMFWLARRFASVAVPSVRTVGELRQFGLYGWLTGTALLLLVYIFAARNLDVGVQAVVIAGVISIGIFTPLQTIFYKQFTFGKTEAPVSSAAGYGLVITVFVALFLVFVLANGMAT